MFQVKYATVTEYTHVMDTCFSCPSGLCDVNQSCAALHLNEKLQYTCLDCFRIFALCPFNLPCSSGLYDKMCGDCCHPLPHIVINFFIPGGSAWEIHSTSGILLWFANGCNHCRTDTGGWSEIRCQLESVR